MADSPRFSVLFDEEALAGGTERAPVSCAWPSVFVIRTRWQVSVYQVADRRLNLPRTAGRGPVLELELAVARRPRVPGGTTRRAGPAIAGT